MLRRATLRAVSHSKQPHVKCCLTPTHLRAAASRAGSRIVKTPLGAEILPVRLAVLSPFSLAR